MNEKTFYTPGPWEMTKPLGPGTYNILSKNINAGGNWHVAVTPACDNPNPEMEANARLIAKAPTMLELLEQAYDRFTDNDMHPPTHELQAWLDKAEAIFKEVSR